jgi:hypothetical protein
MMFGLNMIHILIILVVISIIGLGYLEIRKIKMELESHDKFLKKILIPTIKQPINNQSYCQVQKNTNEKVNNWVQNNPSESKLSHSNSTFTNNIQTNVDNQPISTNNTIKKEIVIDVDDVTTVNTNFEESDMDDGMDEVDMDDGMDEVDMDDGMDEVDMDDGMDEVDMDDDMDNKVEILETNNKLDNRIVDITNYLEESIPDIDDTFSIAETEDGDDNLQYIEESIQNLNIENKETIILNLNKMKNKQLRELLSSNNCGISGAKKVLIDRIIKHNLYLKL